jgi:acyl-coenzyme A synthetase/AMP-(fatty) acid ligase
LHAWVGKGRIGTVTNDWPATWETLRTQAVDALSCTPTFLDLLLQHEPAAPHAWVPRQVTLGGEVLRPHAGARFAARFPATGFTVVYAAAELGVLLRTRRLDGLYELGSLVKRYPCWRLVEGVLEVRRGGQWRSTGDRLKVNGAEVRIVGRADAVANVAGTKVSLAEVAERAEQVPGVRRAVALAEASPVTGQIVCLRWAIEPGSDVRAVTQALEAHLQRHLRKEAWPRRWEREEVGPAANAKRASA